MPVTWKVLVININFCSMDQNLIDFMCLHNHIRNFGEFNFCISPKQCQPCSVQWAAGSNLVRRLD